MVVSGEKVFWVRPRNKAATFTRLCARTAARRTYTSVDRVEGHDVKLRLSMRLECSETLGRR